MPKIKVITVGKIKNKSYQNLCSDYWKRLSHYTKCELIEVKDIKNSDENQRKKLESEVILGKINSTSQIILLDELGKSLTSLSLAQKIKEDDNRGISEYSFVIGGPYGVSQELKDRADIIWSLSTLTLPHELARLTLFEQLYRAHTIIKGEKYHHS